MSLKLPAPSIEAFNQSRQFTADGYEVFEDVIYDTVTYPAAGVNSLDLFTTQSNDETITNLKQPGQIPNPDKFHAYKLFLMPLVEETVDADLTAASRSRDVSRVLVTNRGILKLTPSTTGRTRTGIPLDAIGQIGSVNLAAYGNNAPAAAGSATKVLAQASAHGGYPFEIALASGEEIRGQIKFGNPQAISADMQLRVILFGWRFKKAG